MTRDEIRSALHKAQDRLSKAKIARIQAAHDGENNKRLKELDLIVDDALERCKELRVLLREAEL